MRRIAVLAVALVCVIPRPVRAQVSVGVALGAVGSSTLVADSIVEAIDVRPRLAPQLGLRVDTRLSDRYRVAAELTVARSNLMAFGDSATRVTTLTVWSPTLGLGAAVTPWLAAEARIGALLHDPGETEGTLFADGAPVTPTIGVGLRAERMLGTRLLGAAQLRWDVHRFTTNALKARGFTGETVVHRVALSIAVHRSLGRATTHE